MIKEQDTALSHYIERVRAISRLSRQEEHELALRAHTGDQSAVDRLIEANLRFVVAIALQYRRYAVRLSELISEGNVGLLVAVKKFDPARGTRFVTYAGYWIRAYVLDAVVKSSSLVGAGSGPFRTKLFFRLRRENARAANLASDADAQHEMVARRFNTTPDKVRELSRRLDARDISLDQSVHPESSVTHLEQLVSQEPSQEAVFLDQETHELVRSRLHAALGILDRRERFIMEMRVMGSSEMSLAAIGRKLGVSRERARQLEARAKKKLRHFLEDLRPEASPVLAAAS